jgi:hypothetical protein
MSRAIMVYCSLVCFSLLSYSTSTMANIACPKSTDVDIVGVARDQSSGDFLYCEYHLSDGTVVEYRDSVQQLIARKQLDFSLNRLAPNVQQKDFRHGEMIDISRVETITEPPLIQIAYRAPNSESVKTATLRTNTITVVDAGFDNAIRNQWDELLKNGSIVISFVAPVHLRKIDLSVNVAAVSRCYKPQDSSTEESQFDYDDERHICYIVKSTNMLLNWFVQPIKLIYSRSDKRLMQFSGDVNITAQNGESLRARIDYRYD